MENFEKILSQNVDSLFLSLLSFSLPLSSSLRAAGHSSTELAAPLPRRARCPAMSASPARRPLTFPLPRPVEPAVLCPVDEHAASDERSTTRRDAAVAPNEPGHAAA